MQLLKIKILSFYFLGVIPTISFKTGLLCSWLYKFLNQQFFKLWWAIVINYNAIAFLLRFLVTLGNTQFFSDFYVFPISGVDAIYDVQWLKILGPITNYVNLIMQFSGRVPTSLQKEFVIITLVKSL